jgi:hypothetical protein
MQRPGEPQAAEHVPGESYALSAEQAGASEQRPVEGIDEPTSHVNPDSGIDTRREGPTLGLGGAQEGGMAGPVGYFEGEGNEGLVAPLGGDPARSGDSSPREQGGAASGAPETV